MKRGTGGRRVAPATQPGARPQPSPELEGHPGMLARLGQGRPPAHPASHDAHRSYSGQPRLFMTPPGMAPVLQSCQDTAVVLLGVGDLVDRNEQLLKRKVPEYMQQRPLTPLLARLLKSAGEERVEDRLKELLDDLCHEVFKHRVPFLNNNLVEKKAQADLCYNKYGDLLDRAAKLLPEEPQQYIRLVMKARQTNNWQGVSHLWYQCRNYLSSQIMELDDLKPRQEEWDVYHNKLSARARLAAHLEMEARCMLEEDPNKGVPPSAFSELARLPMPVQQAAEKEIERRMKPYKQRLLAAIKPILQNGGRLADVPELGGLQDAAQELAAAQAEATTAKECAADAEARIAASESAAARYKAAAEAQAADATERMAAAEAKATAAGERAAAAAARIAAAEVVAATSTERAVAAEGQTAEAQQALANHRAATAAFFAQAQTRLLGGAQQPAPGLGGGAAAAAAAVGQRHSGGAAPAASVQAGRVAGAVAPADASRGSGERNLPAASAGPAAAPAPAAAPGGARRSRRQQEAVLCIKRQRQEAADPVPSIEDQVKQEGQDG